MPLKTKQHGQFTVLMAGDIDINHSSLKHQRQNIIAANTLNDILMLIETSQFDLILLDLTINCPAASIPDRLQHSHRPWQSELITRIKDPLGINNQTPVIAIINPAEAHQGEDQYPMRFDGCLTKPVTAEQLNEIIDLWQTKTSALDYIQIILNRTKNNQRLTLTLFEKLFEELPRQINSIKEALGSKQYDLAQEITHKLNGSVSFCGLIDIQQPANVLENCLLNNNYADANRHFLILQQCTLSFMRHQESILANLGKC